MKYINVCVLASICLGTLISLNSITIEASQAVSENKNILNETKFQAKISLKSNNLDIDPRYANLIKNDQINVNSTARGRNEKQKSSRGLSNIWSMLIPGSSKTEDYDDSFDSEVEQSSNLEPGEVNRGSDGENHKSNEVIAPDSSHVEPMKAQTNLSSSEAKIEHEDREDSNRTSEKFSTGSLIEDPNGASQNIADMMHTTRAESVNGTSLNGRGEVDSNQKVYNSTRVIVTPESNNFDRWLNKIQFQEHSRPKQEAMNEEDQQIDSNKNFRMKTDISKIAEALADLRSKRQQSQNKASVSSSEVKGGNMRKAGTVIRNPHGNGSGKFQRAGTHRDPMSNGHPFQHQMIQHQAQLIHGIKYPIAQDSLISVSAQDGASNTSLSFTQNIPSTNSAIFGTEISQIVNNTSEPQTSSGLQLDTSDQRDTSKDPSYPSQDEILRQVTSAINIDQQLNNHSPAEGSRNHRQQGEVVLNSTTPSPSDIDASRLNEIAKLFKQEGPMSEQTQTSTPPSSRLTQAETVKVKSGDRRATDTIIADRANPDDNISLLADKLRLLAMQQQEQQKSLSSNNSTVPSWLQRPLKPLVSLNETISNEKIAWLLANNNNKQTDNKLKDPQVDRVTSLLQQLAKFEKVQKNSSTLANENGEAQTGDQNQFQDNENPETTQEENPNLGWTPLKQPMSTSAPVSPANLMKNRLNLPGKLRNSIRDDDRENQGVTEKRIPVSLTIPIVSTIGDDDFELTQAQLEAAALNAMNQLGGNSGLNNNQLIMRNIHSNRQNQPRRNNEAQTHHIGQVVGMMPISPSAQLIPEVSSLGNSDGIRSNFEANVNQFSDSQPTLDLENASKMPNGFNQGQHTQVGLHKSPSEANRFDNSIPQRPSNQYIQPQSGQQMAQGPAAQVQMHQSNPVVVPPYYSNSQQMNSKPSIGSSHMVTTITRGGGPPIRLREFSLYRPFGFNSHHAITYQPSPTIASLFPGLNNPNRPTFLRNIRPLRSKFSESQRLFSPYIRPQPYPEHLRAQNFFQQSGSFQSHPMMSQPSMHSIQHHSQQPAHSYPMFNQMSPFARHGPAQMKRQSRPGSEYLNWAPRDRVKMRQLEEKDDIELDQRDIENIFADEIDAYNINESRLDSHKIGKMSDSGEDNVLELDLNPLTPKQEPRVNWNSEIVSRVDQPIVKPQRGCTQSSVEETTTTIPAISKLSELKEDTRSNTSTSTSRNLTQIL